MKTLLIAAFASILCAQKSAYIQNRQLWVKQLPNGPARALASDGNPHAPAFSADGAWIAFRDGDRLGVIAPAGGEVHDPLGAESVRSFQWSPIGETLVIATGDSVYVTSSANAWRPSRLAAGAPEWMVFSPDGIRLAISMCESNSDGTPNRSRLEIFPIDRSAPAKQIYAGREWEDVIPFLWTGDIIIAWSGEFSGSMATDGFEIWAYPASGAEPHKLAGPALLYSDLHAISPRRSEVCHQRWRRPPDLDCEENHSGRS